MTTKELKSYIDRILGNNVRCLLPSYWWKRMFGMTLDKMDADKEELIKKIQSAGSKVTVDSALSTTSTNPVQNKVVTEAINERPTALQMLEFVGNTYEDVNRSVYIGNTEDYHIVNWKETNKTNLTRNVSENEIIHFRIKYILDKYNFITLNPVSIERFPSTTADYATYYECVVCINDAYERWRIYVDGSVEFVGLENIGEASGALQFGQERMVYFETSNTPAKLTDEQKAYNAETYKMVCIDDKPVYLSHFGHWGYQKELTFGDPNGHMIVGFLMGSKDSLQEASVRINADGSAYLIGLVNIADATLDAESERPIQNKAVTLALNEKASIAYVNEKVGNAGGNITVDTEFSETSENPIANKTVAKALSEVADAFEGKQNTIADLDEIRSGAAKGATAIQEVKTINNQSILGEGNITIQGGGGGVAQLMTNVTYNELVALRDSASLVPGMYYRITDYETETSSANTMSAHHPFDIVVMALSKDTLSEDARAMQSERDIDGYFTNSNLGAWGLKYCLDNDINRFSWAVAPSSIIDVDLTDLELGVVSAFLNGTFLYEGVSFYRWDFTFEGMTVCFFTTTENPSVGENTVIYLLEVGEILGEAAIVDTKTTTEKGKGVVYHMVDEKQNDVPYDFKNIMFTRKLTNGQYDDVNGVDEFVYTFNLADESGNLDFSLYGLCNSNVMLPASSTLNNNVFLNHTGDARCMSNKFGTYCLNNTFGNFALFNTFGDYCSNNLFGEDCGENSFGNDCYDNIFGNSFNGNKMDGGYGNVFGDTCWGNIIGTSFNDNRLGDNCSGNEFGSENNGNILSHGCDYNKFGYYCRENELGENCSGNTFNNGCARNILGNYCSFNDFGNYCQSHVFGNYCQQISLGDDCFGIIIGVQGVDSYYKRIKIKNGYHIKLVNTESAVSQSQVQNYTIGEISGENQSNKIQLEVFRGRIGETYISKNSNGEIKQWCPADLAQ